jgi:hypothetical protein
VTGWIDLILALIALEGVGLLVLRRVTGRGPSAGALLPNLLAGAALLVAMRLALTGEAPALVGLALLAGLLAHLADLRGRWNTG